MNFHRCDDKKQKLNVFYIFLPNTNSYSFFKGVKRIQRNKK